MLIQFFSDNPYVSALVAFLIGWAFMPMVVRVAKARDFVVKPNKRTSHVGAVPNVGGINIFISFFLSMFRNYIILIVYNIYKNRADQMLSET